MKKKDILKDKEIKQISMNQIDKSNIDNIKSVGTISDHSNVANVVLPLVMVAIGCILAIGIVLFIFNFKFVEGDIYGNTFEVAGVSVVQKDYNPYSYITEGSYIYYDGSNNNFFNSKKDFSIAKITKVGSDGKYYVELNGRNVFVNAGQINYVARG